jgi:antitoxin (DNA-binding transcriptional repressor) of toxin-antitoxin stability system
MKTMDAAKMAESFPTCPGRVVSRQESFEIVKAGIPCAYLVPANTRRSDSHQLAEDIASVELSLADRHALSSAISTGRKALKRLKNPWA